MRIAIITAMPEESKPLLSLAGKARRHSLGTFLLYQFDMKGHSVVLVESGMGFDNAASAVEALFRPSTPDFLISAGTGRG